MAQPFPFETWMNLALCTDLPRKISHSSCALVPAGLGLCCCNCYGKLEKQPPESVGLSTGSGHGHWVALGAAIRLRVPRGSHTRPSSPEWHECLWVLLCFHA